MTYEPEVIPDSNDQGAKDVGACAGHEWIDVTTFADLGKKFLCAGCGMPGKENPAIQRIDLRDRL